MGDSYKEYGFKLPTFENWLDIDRVWRVIGHYSHDTGSFIPETPQSWISEMRAIELDGGVSKEIRSLFEVARSCLIYGFLCYPLLTIGVEQLWRIEELAVRTKAAKLGCSRNKRGEYADYSASIIWLNRHGIIDDADLSSWQAGRKLRNYASHPETQSLVGPSDAIGILRLAAERINRLNS